MKELSIEEKAKRYESALEKCRKLYKEAKANEYISDIEDYETIFPELKESDDEKIKGAIIHFISHTPSVPKGVIGKETMLDWLEKQGQKKCIDDLTQQEAMDIAVAKCFEQGEQKPAWTEEGSMIQNGIILDGVVYELTTGFPDNKLSLCGNCELNEKCIEFDGSLCYFFADSFRKVFRKVKMERKL